MSRILDLIAHREVAEHARHRFSQAFEYNNEEAKKAICEELLALPKEQAILAVAVVQMNFSSLEVRRDFCRCLLTVAIPGR